MKGKDRLSASVDAALLAAVEREATSKRGVTVSAWVSDALRLKLETDRRLDALSALIDEYEAAHGEIRDDEMLAATRRARRQAAPSRAPRPRRAG
ncbi:MAG: hypothetical protein HYS27_26430 [Deltaproteobacteria bacterium]|nr:hypothetical protein [Deltaproteobacteria bacterium]